MVHTDHKDHKVLYNKDRIDRHSIWHLQAPVVHYPADWAAFVRGASNTSNENECIFSRALKIQMLSDNVPMWPAFQFPCNASRVFYYKSGDNFEPSLLPLFCSRVDRYNADRLRQHPSNSKSMPKTLRLMTNSTSSFSRNRKSLL